MLDPLPLLDPLPFPVVGEELIDGGFDVEGAADGASVLKSPRQHSMHWHSVGVSIISIMAEELFELLPEPFPPLPPLLHMDVL